MEHLKFPITRLDSSSFQINVDKLLYAPEAITMALYKYTDIYFIHQQSKGNIIEITFESKAQHQITENIVKQFCNELIDQQVRYNTEKQFGHIRDLIVEEAFKPVNK